jgi:hypothetical protein
VSIFDEIRKKFIFLTPEEWVRQHVVQFLLEKKVSDISYKRRKSSKSQRITQRYDVVVYNPDGSIYILIECKAPSIKIAQATFDQIARYNMTMNAQF